MAASEILDIDPNGDVILICGKEQTKLRVSSAFIAFRSDVMKAMLGPHFKEGRTLASNSRVEVPLPDDDPEAMKTVCYILHQRSSSLPDDLLADQILNIAVIVDKYGWFEALHPSAQCWISHRLQDTSAGSRATLLLAAYLFKDKKSLRELGYEQIQRWTPLTLEYDSCPTMVTDIFIALERHERELRERVCEYIDDQIQHSPVNYHTRLLNQLQSAGLWPSRVRATRSLSEILKAMRDTRVDWPCGDGNVVAKELEHSIKYLCLECVEEGNILVEGSRHGVAGE